MGQSSIPHVKDSIEFISIESNALKRSKVHVFFHEESYCRSHACASTERRYPLLCLPRHWVVQVIMESDFSQFIYIPKNFNGFVLPNLDMHNQEQRFIKMQEQQFWQHLFLWGKKCRLCKICTDFKLAIYEWMSYTV